MPTKRKPFKRRQFVLAIAALLVAYIGSYICLAFRGQWYWSQNGEHRYTFGLAASDVERWFPAWAHWEPFRDVYGNSTSRGDLSGYFYSPLIRLDRKWFHHDRIIFKGKNRRDDARHSAA
jgi:hypothetical protein